MMIKNVANDVVPTICIFSLVNYKQHLDLTTSRKLLMKMKKLYNIDANSFETKFFGVEN